MTDSKRRSAGSVRQNKSGTWSIRFIDPEGARRSQGPYDTEKLAREALEAVLTDIRRGEWFDATKGETRFSEFVPLYLEKREGDGLSPGTLRNYASLWKTQLLPTFGTKKLNQVTVRMVDLWWSKNSKHPVNRRNAYFLLSNIMKTAVRWGYIQTTPCMVENAGRDVAVMRPTWSMNDFRSVVEHLDDEMQTVAWLILCAHLRVSEMAGLNMGDYDATTAVLRVERQDSEIGKRHLKSTKTRQKRSITVLEPGASMLANHLKRHPGLKLAPMFLGSHGARLSAGRFRDAWEAACEVAGVENFHVHDLRHIGLTLVAQAGATQREIQARGGHASITAAARYQHATVERDKEVAARASALLA